MEFGDTQRGADKGDLQRTQTLPGDELQDVAQSRSLNLSTPPPPTQQPAAGKSASAAATPSLDMDISKLKNPNFAKQTAAALEKIQALLRRLRLPQSLKNRLFADAQPTPHYRPLASIDDLDMVPPNTNWLGRTFSCLSCNSSTLVEAGNVGLFQENDEFLFLAPGQHKFSMCGTQYFKQVPFNTLNQPVRNGSHGFITVSEGNLGVMVVSGEYRLLPPGSYQWSSSAVSEVSSVNVEKSVSALGPYTLLTVQEGDSALTYYHGDVRILGAPQVPARSGGPAAGVVVSSSRSEAPPPMMKETDPPSRSHTTDVGEIGVGERTYFLDDPRWRFHTFLTMRQQTDRLEGNDLLSKDNVEVLMVAMSHWQIVNPTLAAIHCGDDMEKIRLKVDSLVRATIARIVAGTLLGRGPVSGAAGRRNTVQVAQVASESAEEASSLGQAMMSDRAHEHMEDLGRTMERMGIEVLGIYIPEKRIKNNDTRQAVAGQAVIGIQAEAQRAAADAEAYTKLVLARAEATAIREVSDAHAKAGEMLGDAGSTASRLALSEATAKGLRNASMTVFTGNPGSMPYMFTDSIDDGHNQRRRMQ